MDSSSSEEVIMLGVKPAKLLDKLPTPEEVFRLPKLTWGNILTKVLGPAFIPLGGAIGSGEWLMGPAVAAAYGLGLFWLVWVSMVLQTAYNCWWARMVAITGEHIYVLLSRIPPKNFWSTLALICTSLRRFWPGWAAATATGILAMVLGRLPGAAEAELVRWTGVAVLLLCAFLVTIGGKIEATMEIAQKVMVFIILGGLIFIVAPLTITPQTLAETAKGIVSVGYVPKGIDILLFAGWFAYIGDSNADNPGSSSYWRDKGYGVGSKVGFIPAVIGGKKIAFSPMGAIFKLTPENLRTWKVWERLIYLDMWLIFFIGGVLGMYLPSMIVASLVPIGTTLPAWGIAAHVSNEFAAKVGPWGYYFIAFIGVVVLFSSALATLETLIRMATEISWTSIERFYKWAKGDIRKIYYPLLAIYLIFGCSAMWLAAPLTLLLISANVVHFFGIWLIPALTYVERKIIPKELRAPIWLVVLSWIMWAFHLFFAIALTAYYGFGIKIF